MIADASAVNAAPSQTSTAHADLRAAAKAASFSCRNAFSSMPGASARATLCWEGRKRIVALNLSVTDSASDGHYAALRVHRRYLMYGWHTITDYVITTKGYKAPKTVTKSRWWDQEGWAMKDFWMQVCKQTSGYYRCDSKWR